MTAILFAGAVFSPRYARRLRHGCREPGLLHPAVHVSFLALERDRVRPLAWVMNEHSPTSLRPLPGGLAVSASCLRVRQDGAVAVDLAERTTRFFGRAGVPLRLRALLRPSLPPGPTQLLSPPGEPPHSWEPRVPAGRAQVEIDLAGRVYRFCGPGYHDHNHGAGRLEDCFRTWSWAHGTSPEGDVGVVLYAVRWRAGGGRGLVLQEDGTVLAYASLDGPGTHGQGPLGPPPPGGHWLRVPAGFCVGEWTCMRQPGVLLDAPFYARYRANLLHKAGTATRYEGIGEYLDLDRFRRPAIQFLLRYRTRQVRNET
ncbi:MAG: hypothetical protein RMK29_19320 [Myxococcales bacterium]|nr:hypothetical protein [Myxococcota bacterium]MDW8283857.1 hypothetical protein [Myxococcales bacterium]